MPEAKWPSFKDHTQDTTHVDDLAASEEKKTFQKEKKGGKHHTAFVNVYPEHYQPAFEETPILFHLLKKVFNVRQATEHPRVRPLFYS